jgi:hypothetical protein
MKTSLLIVLTLTSICLSFAAEETWTLVDGTSIQGSFRGAMPGVILFSGKNGSDQRVPVSQLSETSKRRIVELIGLSSPAIVATTISTPSTLPTKTRDAGAIDATDIHVIASQLGLRAVVIGVVKSVASLGSTGHKKLYFQDTEFEVFLAKGTLEQNSGLNLDGLEGKTIQVTGTIRKYADKLQISLRGQGDLSLVP